MWSNVTLTDINISLLTKSVGSDTFPCSKPCLWLYPALA